MAMFISNEELDKAPLVVKKGDILLHQNESGEWEEVVLEYGTNEKGEESDTLGFYKIADGRSFLASLKGKLLERPTLKFKSPSNPN